MIAMNPPSFDMDEASFTPDNELTRASAIIQDAFTSTASVMSMVDASNAGGNIFTKDVFMDILHYEQSLSQMHYAAADGLEPAYSDLTVFNIMSPVTVISHIIVYGTPPTMTSNSTSAYYDTLIMGIDAMIMSDAHLQMIAAGILSDPSSEMLLSMLTTDHMIGATAASAKGCMVTVMVMDTELSLISGGQRGFESDVISASQTFESGTGLTIKVAGMATMMSEIGTLAQRDIGMLIPIALIVIIALLVIIYRDVFDTLIAILGILIAVIWTFGISALFGIQMSTIAIAVPILILALGIDYSLHLVFRYREERMSGQGIKGAITRTFGSVGEALILATVTTAIAFLSYLTSAMSALADFGLMCAIGIVCAFGAMLLLIPPLQITRDRRARKKGKDPDEAKRYRRPENENGDALSKISGIGGRMAAKNPWAVLGAVGVIVVLFGYGATNMSYNFNMYDIPEGTDAHDILTYMDENHSATTSTTSVLVYDDGWKLDVIKAMEDSLENMNASVEAEKIRGLAYRGSGPPDTVDADYMGTALSQFNDRYGAMPIPALGPGVTYGTIYDQVFNADGTLKSAATQTALNTLKMVTPQEAVSSVAGMYEGQPVTRMILKMTVENEGDNDAIVDMKNRIDDACSPLDDAGCGHVTTGQFIIMAVNMKEMNSSQMTSLFTTIIFVLLILTVVMYFVDRSFLIGTLATIPTLISVIMVWGTMALINMPLNVMTLTIASLAVGMGVTYGIHISHRFVSELVKDGVDEKQAIMIATHETGKGVFAAAITTVAGFGVMGFSKILPMYQFGIITALAIAFGYMGSVLILPSLLVIWGRNARPKIVERMKAKNAESSEGRPYTGTPRKGDVRDRMHPARRMRLARKHRR
jgi:hypothetical protein